ncbi:MAG: TrmH family RNA methyltransferase, partial [Deinococcota bacterium]
APRCKLDANAYALASHAADVLDEAVICDSLPEALASCQLALGTTARSRVAEDPVYTPREATQAFPHDATALVFGPEDFGLSNEDLQHCQAYITIPTGDYASLNLAQAVHVMAYEWFVSRTDSVETSAEDVDKHAPRLPRADMESMYRQLKDVLHLIGYTDIQREASAMTLFRRVFDSTTMTARDLAAVRGLWRQVAWAARTQPNNLPRDSRDTDSD